MKKLIVGVALSIMSLNVNAQFWVAKGSTVKVCSAYGHGKFSGYNGKRPHYVHSKGSGYNKTIRLRKRFATRRRHSLALVK